MRRYPVIALSALSLSLFAGGAAAQQLNPSAPLTDATAALLAQNVNRAVIVLMKNPYTGLAALNDQSPLMAELSRVQARRVRQYRLVNAFAATVSAGELERLRANPAVAEVVSDSVLRRAPGPADSNSGGGNGADLAQNLPAGACSTNPTAPLLEPEALQVTHTDGGAGPTARALGFTGAGVTVAFIADGIDTANANFIRPSGQSAFVDYQDFSGDGANAPTGGGEAFLDSNAIAGQGTQVYDIGQFSAQPDPGGCYIRIEGVAPGASLVGLKAFATSSLTTNSDLLQAIEYAVLVDHVDVLNESFGANNFPSTAQDITRQFNDAAVALGTTVTISTGDSGANNTIQTTSNDPNVISVGATTTFRAYAQSNEGGAQDFATNGWLDDNISALSSGGFDQSGRTLDLVAPGDLGWASCDANPNYADCINDLGQPSEVESSGGTSLSSPLVAGAAALVIQAYRATHHGATPSPALIKQILLSTATNLGTPAVEQGAGLLNTYAAVRLAESINHGAPAAATPLVLSANQFNLVARPGTTATWLLTLTNAGATAQTVALSGQTLGPQQNVQTGSVELSSAPEFELNNGKLYNYETFTFTVPPGVDRLDAAIAYPAVPYSGADARLSLVDPQGRFAAYTLPQGQSNTGNVDVREPAPGVWTGVIFLYDAYLADMQGPIGWQVYTQSFVPFGAVSPSHVTLAAGASRTVLVSAATPYAAGDTDGSIVVTASAQASDGYTGQETNSVPVTVRSLVNLDDGGNFGGVLTGGNGRSPGVGQEATFQFKVGPGHRTLAANVTLSTDYQDTVGAYLVSPDGATVGMGENTDALTGQPTPSLTVNTVTPQPGMWTLVVDFANQVAGDVIAQPFTGNVALDNVVATAPGLPDSPHTKLAAGVPVTIPVTITNSGLGTQAIFMDARLKQQVLAALAPQYGGTGTVTLPLNSGETPPYYLVPSETTSMLASAASTVPIEFDYSFYPGDPDLFGAPIAGNRAIGFYAPRSRSVSAGLWTVQPGEIGPYPATGAPQATADVSLVVRTRAFDPAVSSPTGDFWLAAFNPDYGVAPVDLQPGQTATIPVTITPSGARGTVVRGVLYVGSMLAYVVPGNAPGGNEVIALPYAYKIK